MSRKSDREERFALERFLASERDSLNPHRNAFLMAESVSVTRRSPNQYSISGRLLFLDGVYLDFEQSLVVEGRQWARVRRYSYHVGQRGAVDRPILRYDNAHRWLNQPDAHHCHRFDRETGQESGPPLWIGEGSHPRLGDVVREVYERWIRGEIGDA